MKRFDFILFSLLFPMLIWGQTSGGQISRPTKKTTSPANNVVKISDPDGYINNHGYVDLGLPSGTKWATCNVGARSPSQYGDYLAWGETEPKKEYRYKDTPLYGVAIDDISNNEKYDVARIKWGNGWAIPTKEQWDELIEYCKLKATKKNGIEGIQFVGKNGKSVFFPAGGRKLESILQYDGDLGYYWSSNADYKYHGNSAYASNAFSTVYIIGMPNNVTPKCIVFSEPECREYGMTIRPICR